MGSKDPRVDAYIARAAAFAQPILARLRADVHAGCPMVVETMRWGLPHFEYRGLVVSLAVCPTHCTLCLAPRGVVSSATDAAAERRRFERMTRLTDLPSAAVVKARIRSAVALPPSTQEPA